MMTISALARRCGLSRSTLLYYEAHGLLRRPPRTAPAPAHGVALRRAPSARDVRAHEQKGGRGRGGGDQKKEACAPCGARVERSRPIAGSGSTHALPSGNLLVVER